jgi:hypothetical protein
MGEYVNCPRCGSDRIAKVSYTWWGGFIGPAMLTHVKCQDCGLAYNGRTGQSNTAGIIIYSVVVGVIAFVVFFAIFFALHTMR